MLLGEIVEEIAEKSGNFLSPQSIIRKINVIKGNLKRNYSGNEPDTSRMDLAAGLGEYPLTIPAGSIIDVVVKGVPYPQRRLKEDNFLQYYYLLDRRIGIHPTPKEDVLGGLVIFNKPISKQLTLGDMSAEPDFDSDYHMLLVYGVLIDILKGKEAEEYKGKYDWLLAEFNKTTGGPEFIQIREVYRI